MLDSAISSIKRCPHCGGVAIVLHTKLIPKSDSDKSDFDSFSVRCVSCGASSGEHYGSDSDLENIMNAIITWNKRSGL